jgi:hypothetical protein
MVTPKVAETMIKLVAGLIALWISAAWLTHIVVCFANDSWGFLVAGAIAFPVAWAHGTWIWFT